jgi:beta-ureidopropionase / N-carbamoyl-L-amino-acid hydrolase
VIALELLNGMSEDGFVSGLAGIFEHSPWVAQRAAAQRPFASRLQLLDAMRGVVQAAAAAEQLALIRAHPQLGAGRVALTEASAGEQRRAGLDACTSAQLARLAELNAAYLERFEFPFVLAVRGHDPASIIARLERRLCEPATLEQRSALGEIGLIAGFRLADVVATSAGAEILAMSERFGRSESRGRERSARDSLVREWMLAAGLELRLERAEAVIGYVPGGALESSTLALGVHYDPAAALVRYDGPLGFIIGIAVMQQLRQQGVRARFALAILARIDEECAADLTEFADAESALGCVALSVAGAADADGASTLTALRAAALPEPLLAVVRRHQAGLFYRAPSLLDSLAAERAARILQQLLLQTQPPMHYHS